MVLHLSLRILYSILGSLWFVYCVHERQWKYLMQKIYCSKSVWCFYIGGYDAAVAWCTLGVHVWLLEECKMSSKNRSWEWLYNKTFRTAIPTSAFNFVELFFMLVSVLFLVMYDICVSCDYYGNMLKNCSTFWAYIWQSAAIVVYSVGNIETCSHSKLLSVAYAFSTWQPLSATNSSPYYSNWCCQYTKRISGL